jgi:natural product biosynthesis luciferase-like monooxygenase protein
LSAPADDPASALRAALVAIRKQQARIAELEAARPAAGAGGGASEPIAIVGIGCRFPGSVRGPEAFWAKLKAGFDAVGDVPPDRWPVEDYFNADPEHPGTMYTRRGAFVDDVDKFDARFFGISPREALTMDPQQRLLLETAWEALEDAGLPPERLAGSATGVYVGLTVIDYLKLVYRDDLARVDAYCATGNIANIAAGRLSYFFGLRGPAMTLDTACSSSLVSIHLACQSLRTGESTLALAAGVNLILAPDNSVAVSRARMLAPDGHCKTFDAAADGYARGEGCGVLVLKRLAQAQAEGDRIHAVIRGTAVAQDGARSGLTVPNGPAQTALIKAALASAGVEPAAVSYLEAHGTGTALGDPIEAEALAGVFGRDAQRATPLVVGSLKTNVGHMESAAGVGGVIKTALALRQGEIPAHLHFKTENPEVRLGDIPAVIPLQHRRWPDGYARRIAGVSSFGSSGTIAHVVLEAPPALVPARVPWPAGKAYPLFLSAKTPAALRRLAARYAAFLRALPPGTELADVCWTAAMGRTVFAQRRLVTGCDAAELATALEREESGATAAAVADPDPNAFFGDWAGRRVALPTYAFERERHWVEPEVRTTRTKARTRAFGTPSLPGAGLDFGIMFFNGTERSGADSYRLLFESSRFADAHGFGSVWLPERHFTAFGGLYPNPATLHAALARETGRLRLMAGSSVLPLHDLRRLAEEWSVVDNLSQGRAGMSFASGWNPADFSLRPEAYADRHDRLFAGIEDLRRLWRGEALPAAGGDGKPVTVRIYPTPVQKELPLWVTTAGNPKTFERAGATGANVLTHLLDQDVSEIAEKIVRYRAARAAAGHDPAAGRVTVMLHSFIGANAEAVHAKVRAPFTKYLQDNIHLLSGLAASRGRAVDVATLSESERAAFVGFLYERFVSTRALLGTPESCAPLVRRLAAAGVTEIACLLDFGPADDDVLAMLPDLAAFRATMAAELAGENPGAGGLATRAPEGWHELAWRPVALTAAATPPAGRWVIAADGGGTGEALATRLRAAGCEVSVTPSGQAIDATGAAVIVNLRPIDATCEPLDTLAVVQATTAKLWTVTRGAQTAAGATPDPRSAAHAALLRVLPVEQPQRWGGLIDLDLARPAAAQVDALAAVVLAEAHEDQLALRGNDTLAARLITRRAEELPSGQPFAPRADATYLITGGLSGVGWEVARWLVAGGAKHLLLISRREADAAQRGQMATWAAASVAVTAAAVDIRDRAALERALAAHRRAGAPTIAGVFHAAGAWRDVPLADLTAESFSETWAAKVDGARHLDALLGDTALDVFVGFSAFSAVLPAPGQGNYAAANAALDAIVQQRRARGASGLTINWGPWSDVGFAATDYGHRAHARLESLGITRFRPADGLAKLAYALATSAPQLAVMRIEWAQLFTADPQARLSPLLRDLLAVHAPSDPVAPAEAGRILALLAGKPATQQLGLLTLAFAAVVAAVLRMRVEDVPVGTAMTELGVDSLVAIEIKNRIQLEAGVDVSLTALLEGPSCAKLAGALLAQVKVAALARTVAASEGPVEEIEL